MSVAKVRLRVAPSPTGDPHVGLAYITLFNYVFARKFGGQLILRIEDTDQARTRATSEREIFSSLKWLGLDWDEGPDVGGDFGPYRQSERLPIYHDHVEKLIAEGKAYRCFCSQERLDQVREQQRALKQTPRYDGHCRGLSRSESDRLLAAGGGSVVRLLVPEGDETTSFIDELRGPIEIKHSQLDDQVLLKSDGFPTYHLANVVDDHLMEISHVVRAEEWISSTPKHVLLYEAFGWQTPKFVHLPLLRNKDRSKISKRKNPVSLTYYEKRGILPDAMRNFLGLMGWSMPDDTQEVFTLKEMIDVFEFKDIHLGGPVFDVDKLMWLNQQYIQNMSAENLVDYALSQTLTRRRLIEVVGLMQKRIDVFDELFSQSPYFFVGPVEVDPESVFGQLGKSAVLSMLREIADEFDQLDSWTGEVIQACLDKHRKQLEWKPKDYFMTLRQVICGTKQTPPVGETLAVVGKELVRFRLRRFVNLEAP